MEKRRGYTDMTNEMSTEDRLEELAYLFNRKTSQLTQHFNLVDKNFKKLFELENKMRNNHLSYGCGDKEEVDNVLNNYDYGDNGWNFNHYYLDPFTKSMVFLLYYSDDRVDQELKDRYQGPKAKEYFYNYLWNDYAKDNIDVLSKQKMIDIDLLKSTLL